MIFITVGSQKFQFDRLFLIIDDLIENGIFNKKEVFAQVGHSSYTPKNYGYQRFLMNDEIENYYDNADLIITHAGTGTIINCLKKNKKIIVFPRNVEYGEHVDNHQFQIADLFYELGYCLKADNYDSLKDCIEENGGYSFKTFISNNDNFSRELTALIEGLTESGRKKDES